MKKICTSILLMSSTVFGVTFVNEQVNRQSQPGLIVIGNPTRNDNLRGVLSRKGFNEESFQKLLDSKGDIDEEIEIETPSSFYTRGAIFFLNERGTRLLHSTRFNDEKLAKWLVEHDADVNKATKKRYTPLIVASGLENEILVKYFVEHGADINAETKNGENSLMMAFQHDNKNLFHYLIENGARVSNKAGAHILFRSILKKDIKSVKDLIIHGADINMAPEGGYPPLLAALKINDHPLTEFFVDLREKVEGLKDERGMTPLLLAIRNGCSEKVCRYLIENGDDVNAKVKGCTPLLLAFQQGDENLIRLLIDNGADVNVVNDRGETPLFLAVRRENTSLILFLLEHGATDVMKENFWGDCPLLLAQENAQYEQDSRKKAEWRKIINMIKEIIKNQL